MGTSFKCKDLLEKLQKTFDLMGNTIVYFGDDGSLTTGGLALNRRDADVRSQENKEEKLNSAEKEEAVSPAGKPTEQSLQLKPSICRCANCGKVGSVKNVVCKGCGVRF